MAIRRILDESNNLVPMQEKPKVEIKNLPKETKIVEEQPKSLEIKQLSEEAKLEKLTLVELRSLALSKGIKFPKNISKPKIIVKIIDKLNEPEL